MSAKPRRTAPRTGRTGRTGQKISPHADWLALVETVEPFLDLEVLDTALPQGCPPVATAVRDRLALAVEELRAEPAKVELFVEFVLREVLAWDLDGDPAYGAAVRDSAVPAVLAHRPPSARQTLRPDIVLLAGGKPEVLVTHWPAETRLDRAVPDPSWAASPIDRMVELCRATGNPVGLVTNGWRWAIVHAAKELPVGVATFDAEIWVDEPVTLAAFADLLGAVRWLSRPDDEHLSTLLNESGNREEAVTGQLGAQVRAAVEHLVDAFSRADRQTGGAVLAGVSPREVYRGAVTATMRLVFLLYAEDRGLLPINDELYRESYAAHSLFHGLRADADRLTEDILDRRSAAWGRLLATSRAVHGGSRHDKLRLPAYGGSLFDPARYPWLAGLRVDDRTMLRVLDRLLMLRREGRASIEAQPISYRSLDVEQIGYVYEGLLDHSGLRADDTVLALLGPAQPEIPLSTLEALTDAELVPYLVAEMSLGTKRKVNAAQVQRWLDQAPDAGEYAALRAACGGDDAITARVLPYWGLLRADLRGGPLVYGKGAVYVTQVGDRRAAGAHYTPKHLAEEMVKHTLDPLCHSPGPAEGLGPDDEWTIRPAKELLALRVADIAVGSGAFLVSACRYLADLVVRAWQRDGLPNDVPAGESSDAQEERLVYARRLVADRCLYGVDRDDMAVEMAKMSMWLVTLAKRRPFEFLDHALRRGDSLLGITDLDQLLYLHLDPKRGRELEGHVTLFEDAAGAMTKAVGEALTLRHELTSFPVNDVRDAEDKDALLTKAEQHTRVLKLIANAVVAAAVARPKSEDDYKSALTTVGSYVKGVLAGNPESEQRLVRQTEKWLQGGRPGTAPIRECFHWPLEFPEVMEHGFSAIVGNPPFQGGLKISGPQGTDYREFLVRWVAGGCKGSADLVAYFFLRAAEVATAGRIGLIATNTIGQGDTREVALDRLTEAEWSIIRAVKSIPWPGEATLEVSKVWLGQRGESEAVVLDDISIHAITPALDPASRVTGAPHRLADNSGTAFIGAYVLGLGFTMPPSEAQELISRDSDNTEILFPYLNGEDLNSRPDSSASRWVINFHDWPLERAERYPECMDRVVRLVKPERARNNDRSRREVWWRFTRPAIDLQEAIKGLDRVLTIARVSKVVLPVFVPTKQVISDQIVVFATDDAANLALLSSAAHYWWAIERSSTLETRIRYTPSDVSETFARPELTGRMRGVGERLDSYRRGLMLDRNEGLTKTYNRVHNPDERAADIAELRAIHVEIDHAVAEAYGWQDLELDHGFHETRQGTRYTVGPTVRQEILDRLLELNFARYADEQQRGLHNKGKPSRGGPAKVPKPRTATNADTPSLF